MLGSKKIRLQGIKLARESQETAKENESLKKKDSRNFVKSLLYKEKLSNSV